MLESCVIHLGRVHLDLVINLGRPLGLLEIARIREAMSDSDLPMFVDIVDWYGLSGHLQEQVKQSGVVLSAPGGDPERG